MKADSMSKLKELVETELPLLEKRVEFLEHKTYRELPERIERLVKQVQVLRRHLYDLQEHVEEIGGGQGELSIV